MKSRQWTCGVFVGALALAGPSDAQWRDAKLIAGQVGFNVAASFVGKWIVGGRAPGPALREALREGAASGLMAHAGYTIAGIDPDLALVGKVLTQKAALTTRRSIRDLPVFDATLYRNWEITHSFVHLRWDGSLRLQLDAINAAFTTYYVLSPEAYDFDLRRTLASGSFVFRRPEPPPRLRGFYVPGVIWVDADDPHPDNVLSHEIVHSFQAERGSSIRTWSYGPLRLNWLVFGSGVPALLAGWPEHDTRWHEVEADRYADTR